MSDSFSDAARRHRQDAKHLAAQSRFQNAGHLIGFAGECLVKEMLEKAGTPINRATGLRDHFPSLVVKIKIGGYGRLMGPLLPLVTQPDFLDGWRAELRYEANKPPANAERQWRKWVGDVDGLFFATGIP